MPYEIEPSVLEFIRVHRVAHLATASADSIPSVAPVCFASDGENIFSPIDEKPKSAAAGRLQRVRNITDNPNVALVIDDYDEDWRKLIYVLIRGTAEVIWPGDDPEAHSRAVRLLREKYSQYRSMRIDELPILKIKVSRIKRWPPADRS